MIKKLNLLQIEYERNGFKWNEYQQSTFLGSFYWLNWATQLPGGILAAKYGTKMVFGLSNYIAIVLCAITPIACYLDYRLLIFIRVVSGAVAGETFLMKIITFSNKNWQLLMIY